MFHGSKMLKEGALGCEGKTTFFFFNEFIILITPLTFPCTLEMGIGYFIIKYSAFGPLVLCLKFWRTEFRPKQ